MAFTNSTPKIILLEDVGAVMLKERSSSDVITPGNFVTLNSSNEFSVQITPGGAEPKMVALQNDIVGQTIDDTYAVGDNVIAAAVQPGDVVYTFVAAGEAALAIGAIVEYNDEGGVRAVTSGTPVGIITEAVDNSGGSSAARAKVQII